jgi:succinoglycan biosynthesis transport protein ExoP
MVEMVESNLNTIPETEPGYGQLFAILIRRRYWLLGVLCIALAVSTVKAVRAKPTYQSSLQLLVEPIIKGSTQEGQAGAEKEIVDPKLEVDSATQLSLMQSTQLLQSAVTLLRPDYPDLNAKQIKNP